MRHQHEHAQPMNPLLILALCWALILGFGYLAYGQTVHPCDEPPQTQPSKGSIVGWCHDLRDDDGLTLTAIGFFVTIADQTADLGLQQPARADRAPGSGDYYFQAALPEGYPRGFYPVYLTAYVPGEPGTSGPSNTVTWQRGGPPNAPKHPRVAVVRAHDGALYARQLPAEPMWVGWATRRPR